MLFDWKKFRNITIYITPNFPDKTTKRYKFSLPRIIGYFIIYTFFAWLIFILILGVTPIKNFIFVLDQEEYKTQTEKLEDLQRRVAVLTAELQNIASTNERMKYAVKLARQDSVDSTNALYDTLRAPINKKLKLGGNIIEAFGMFLQKLFPDSGNSNQLIFQKPVDGIITQQFSPDAGHLGIDFGVKKGAPVYASAGGFVVFSDYTLDNGYMMIIKNSDNYITIYQHCSSLLKKVRDVVTQGELIALSGNSGNNTTGPHLHFEIWYRGKPVDPAKLIIK